MELGHEDVSILDCFRGYCMELEPEYCHTMYAEHLYISFDVYLSVHVGDVQGKIDNKSSFGQSNILHQCQH